MAIPLEFTMDGSPVSQQTRRRKLLRQWTRDVRSVAEREWKDEPPVAEELMVTITYFYDSTSIDVDNIPKPTLDALKGLVYIDDGQITDMLCRKRVLRPSFQTQNLSPVLHRALGLSRQFVHIKVDDAPDQEVVS